MPKGWSVEPDYSLYGGFVIGVPADAPLDNRYEVRYSDSLMTRSGFFHVIPGSIANYAPVLMPLVVSPPISASNIPCLTINFKTSIGRAPKAILIPIS